LIKLKQLLGPVIFIFAALVIILFLNTDVTTRQGVDYQWKSIKIPLYLKILDFFDRHYNYKRLTEDIIKDSHSDREKVMLILQWTNENIRRVPNGYPIVDDHVWHIIVRGYGARDQSNDVFSTLCNYAGLDALYVRTGSDGSYIPISLVKFADGWKVFDSYNGIYFVDSDDSFASFSDIASGDWRAVNIKSGIKSGFDYGPYLTDLPKIEGVVLARSSTQSPLKRFLFEVRKWKGKIRYSN